MTSIFRFSILSFFIFAGNACSVDSGSESSRISIELPSDLQGVGKAVTKSGAAGVACFAISLRGQGIPDAKPGACDPPYGDFIGFVQGGNVIEMEVDRGMDRTLEVFYLSSAGGCENIQASEGISSLTTAGSNFVHRVSLVKDIQLDRAVVTIQVPLERPSVANTIDRVYNLPTQCRVGQDNVINPSRFASNVAGSIQGTFSGSGRKLSLRLKPTAIKVSNNPSSTIKLKPHRLGVQ